MKIAITGHTSGIGKCLFENLSQEHDVTGYSRSNGFDISNTENREQIANTEYDIFINNAYNFSNMGNDDQIEMLKLVYEKHFSDYDKIRSAQLNDLRFLFPDKDNLKPLIINIGSAIYRLPDMDQGNYGNIDKFSESNIKWKYYKKDKKKLQDYIHLKRICDIRPGMIESSLVENSVFVGHIHNPVVVYDAVKYVIDAYYKHGAFIYTLEVV